MKNIITLTLLLTLMSSTLSAQNEDFRENIDILKYSINLNITDFKNKNIKGNTEIILNLIDNKEKKITLDFEALEIDSVLVENKKNDYKYNNRYLEIPYSDKNQKNIKIIVWYHGKPLKDNAWGGFYFTDSSAFNMGVGMASDPKAYGRVWYPCSDSFTDKALYNYKITVPKNYTAVCSGILSDSVINNNNTITFNWEINREIPTYLSSVAVAKYTVIKDIYKGIKREIPIEIYSHKTLKNNAYFSFYNLKNALKIFETEYGEYVWERVGYVGVDFNSGAMEHACNIAYPNYAIDGTRDRETLMAHELSHSWFGNLVTCKTAGDMWLNEGWASFSEALFKEKIYGHSEYMDYVLNNHIKVLTNTHINDGGYYPVYGIPSELTYGSTVYDKGADVAFTLRNYMGDSLFFSCLHSYFEDYAYKSVSTEEFKNYFSVKSKINLDNFFRTWVYTAGFPHFSIYNFKSEKENEKFNTEIIVNQKLKERNYYGKDNIADFVFYDEKLNKFTLRASFSGSKDTIRTMLTFEPLAVFIDPANKIADADIGEYFTINKPGKYYFNYTNFTANIQHIKDSIVIECKSNFIKADFADSSSYAVSDYQYWTVSGISNKNTKGNFEIFVSTYENKIFETADKIFLLYRKNSSDKFEKINVEKKLKNDYVLSFTRLLMRTCF